MTAPTTPTADPVTGRTVEQVARARYVEQVALAAAASRAALDGWADLDLGDIAHSWARLLGLRALRQVEQAQLAAARTARSYVDRVLAARQRTNRRARRHPVPELPLRRPRLVPERLVGVAADGRPLPTLLYQPAVTALRAIEAGRTPQQAAVLGGTQLDMIVRTQIADTGRVATGVEIAATPTLGYVRMLNPPSCSRCAILAGRFYRWNVGFQRHPRCDCIHIPVSEDQADDLRTDPRRYFDSLPEAEQRRIFTVAGAQAIRDGADIGRVVNARRGMSTTARGRLGTARVFGRDAFVTTEGTGRGRNRRPARLMPEQIYLEAGGDRDEAIRLLRLHGYIT